MPLLDDIKNSILEISKDPKTVIRRSEETLEIQKARLQKQALEKDLIEQYAEVGRLYLARLTEDEMPEDIRPVARRIRACLEAIEETKQRLYQGVHDEEKI